MRLFSAALVAVLWFAGSGPQVFEGEISDSQCAFNVHSRNGSHDEMIKTNTMGRTPEECTLTCVRYRSGKYVLMDPAKKKIYRLEPQDGLEKFAGKKVLVRGSADKNV